MRVSFEELADHARVWIYQSDRELSQEEVEEITGKASVFVEQWAAHGKGLLSSAKVFYNRFLILSVDEGYNSASGCSIDASVNFIKNLGQQYNVDFLGRTQIPFLKGENVFTVPINTLQMQFDEGTLSENSITFNNLVSDIKHFKSDWIVPVKDSWLNRYLKKTV